MKPTLLLDIDGPLNPEGAKWHPHADQRPPGWAEFRYTGSRVLYNPTLGARLAALSDRYDLVWASGWCDDAPGLYGPLIGLDGLPFIDFDGAYRDLIADISGRLHWKTRAIAAWATEHDVDTLAWFDDEVATRDGDEIAALLGVDRGNVLTVRVPSATGLTDAHFDALADFADRHRTEVTSGA